MIPAKSKTKRAKKRGAENISEFKKLAEGDNVDDVRQVLRQLFSEQDHNAERALCPEEMDIIHEGIKKIEIEKPTQVN